MAKVTIVFEDSKKPGKVDMKVTCDPPIKVDDGKHTQAQAAAALFLKWLKENG